jgi:hypothetical protein
MDKENDDINPFLRERKRAKSLDLYRPLPIDIEYVRKTSISSSDNEYFPHIRRHSDDKHYYRYI